jgi:serine/threonine protein kinase
MFNIFNMEFPTRAAFAKQILKFNPKQAWRYAMRAYTHEEYMKMGAIIIPSHKEKVQPGQPSKEHKPTPKADPRILQNLDGYTKCAVLGEGGQGVVFKCVENATGRIVAVKECPFTGDAQFLEFTLQDRASGPRVVKVHAAETRGETFFIVMDLVEGTELEEVLYSPDWDESATAFALKNVLLAVQDVHKKNIVFCDVKCQNVLASATGEVKLTDFGLAVNLEDSTGDFKGGTPEYIAPEVLSRTPDRVTRAFDVWSVGMMAVRMHEGMPTAIEDEEDPQKVLRLVRDSPAPQLQTACEDGLLSDFVKQALVKNPADRATIPELLAHPFLAKACSREHFAGLVQNCM